MRDCTRISCFIHGEEPWRFARRSFFDLDHNLDLDRPSVVIKLSESLGWKRELSHRDEETGKMRIKIKKRLSLAPPQHINSHYRDGVPGRPCAISPN
jgi:hypothetical protein